MRILGIVLIVLQVSCNRPAKIIDLSEERIKNEVILMFKDYHRDIKSMGLTAEFKYLDKSDQFFWVPPGYNSPLTYDSVETILKMNAKAFSSVEFTWDTLNIHPLSEEIASFAGIVNGLMIDTAGVESKMSIIESGIVIKRSSGWKLLSGQSTLLDLPKNMY